MGAVNMVINGRNYEVACDDGQEERLQVLGGYIDSRVSELIDQMGQVGELRLLVMAALLIADELQDALAQLDAIDDAQAMASAEGQVAVAPAGAAPAGDAAAAALEETARRLESIAARLEGT